MPYAHTMNNRVGVLLLAFLTTLACIMQETAAGEQVVMIVCVCVCVCVCVVHRRRSRTGWYSQSRTTFLSSVV